MIAVYMVVALLVSGLILWGFHRNRSKLPMADGGYVRRQEHSALPSGIVRWLTTVDHKDIGTMYLIYGVIAFAWGGLAALLFRIELFTPGNLFIDMNMYNALFTTHGTTMLFLFGSPILASVGNYFLPLLIGADDMAFPRINAIAFWILPFSAILIWAGFFAKFLGIQSFGPARTGWTMYTPLSLGGAASLGNGDMVGGAGVDLFLLGLHLSGISVTMAAVNFMVTIFTERHEDIGWPNLDIFSWCILSQSALVLFSFPLLGSGVIMLLLDRNFGANFFTVNGGTPILWQHIFWFFGHPEVYILILPPFGLVSYIIPRFSGRKLFGRKFVIYSALAFAVMSYSVWAHHMFVTGISPQIRAAFMASTFAIAIPSAIKTFNWISTMWNGSIELTTPMLFCIGFVFNFIIGGITGVFLGSIPVNRLYHGTYYVIGHFHYVIMGAIVFAVFAGMYFWFPIMSGRMYNKTLGKIHFWSSMIGGNMLMVAMMVLGGMGMPRRYATYQPHFMSWHQIATIGALIFAWGALIWLWNMVQSWRTGPKIQDADVWNLKEKDAHFWTKEWQWFEEEKLGKKVPDGGEKETTE